MTRKSNYYDWLKDSVSATLIGVIDHASKKPCSEKNNKMVISTLQVLRRGDMGVFMDLRNAGSLPLETTVTSCSVPVLVGLQIEDET